MSKFKETKMLGFSMPFFLIMVVVFMAIALTGSTMASFVGALGFCLIVGTLIGWGRRPYPHLEGLAGRRHAAGQHRHQRAGDV